MYLVGGADNKDDSSLLGSAFGSPYSGKLPSNLRIKGLGGGLGLGDYGL